MRSQSKVLVARIRPAEDATRPSYRLRQKKNYNDGVRIRDARNKEVEEGGAVNSRGLL